MTNVNLTLNGKAVSADVPDNTLLVSFIRETMALTGTHVGCDTSQCGACVVHVNGESVKSCTMLAVAAEGAEVTTIEGSDARNRCIRCSRRFTRTMACSAVSAHPAW